MKCPDCKSKKEIMIFPKLTNRGEILLSIPCPRCNAKGVVTDEMSDWIKIGSGLRELRLKKVMPLRDLAAKMKIDPSFLSSIEKGFIDPSEFANTIYEILGKE